MEAIEDDLSVGAALLDRFDEGIGHIDGDELDGEAAFFSQLIEESVEGLGGFALSDPDGLAVFVVHDDGDVLVSALVGELVDSDVGEEVESVWVEFFADDSRGDATDGDPGDLEEAFHGRLVGDPSETGDLILEVASKEGPGSGPGDLFAADAATAAADSPKRWLRGRSG